MKYILLILVIIIMVFTNLNETHRIYGKTAKTSEQKRNGLMYRKDKLQDKEGMLFVMGEGNNSVWMKNTYISLDVIFLDSEMMVVGYKQNTEPLSTTSISINNISSYILEMNSGSVDILDITIGDNIHFKIK